MNILYHFAGTKLGLSLNIYTVYLYYNEGIKNEIIM